MFRRLRVLVLVLLLLPVAAVAQVVSSSASPSVAVDPRIELLGTVFELAGGKPGWTPVAETDYHRQRRAQFARYRHLDAVRMSRDMPGLAWSTPAQAIVHFGPPPGLMPIASVPEDVVQAMGGRERFMDWMNALRSFAHRTRYMEFFAAQQPAFERMAVRTRTALDGIDLVAPFERWYGLHGQRYSVIVSPSLLPGAFGPSVRDDDDRLHFHSIQGMAGVVDGLPWFGDGPAIASLSWHEWGHAIVNPLDAGARSPLAESAALYDSMAEDMRKAAYMDWESAANELQVRAAASRICATTLRTDAAWRCLELQHPPSLRGEVYMQRMADGLETMYEPGRAQYPDYAAFHRIMLLILRAMASDP